MASVDWGKPFDNRDGKIWFDGKLVEWNDATIHVLNHGLHYGSSVFEGLRIYNRKPFKLVEHMERLHRSAEMLDFKIPFSVEELCRGAIEAIDARDIVDGYLRPVAWRGSEQMAILTDKSTIHVAQAAWSWPAYFGDEALQKGLNLTFSKWKRPSPETAPCASKAAGLYMICTMTKNQAVRDGFDDALMLDYRGYLAEATGANMFLVFNGELHTPTPDCFLNGLTRQTVMQIAKESGLKVVERHIMPDELANATECFLTGSAAEITPIGTVKGICNGQEVSYKFTVGDITKSMMEKYSALVRA